MNFQYSAALVIAFACACTGDCPHDTASESAVMITAKLALQELGEVRCSAMEAAGGSLLGANCVQFSGAVQSGAPDVSESSVEACLEQLAAEPGGPITLNPLSGACKELYGEMELLMPIGHFFMTFDAEYRETLDGCDSTHSSTVIDLETLECEFNETSAHACLGGAPWRCSEDRVPILPSYCLNVFTCSGTGTTSPGSTTPT